MTLNYYYLWSWLLANLSNILGIVASLATITASVLAFITLKMWRKQQLYGNKFELLMQSEDNFELLVSEHAEIFRLFYLEKLGEIKSKNVSQEHKNKINNTVKENFEKFTRENTLATSIRQYQLSHLRMIRLFPEKNNISYEKHKKFFDKYLDRIEKKYFNSEEELNKCIKDSSDFLVSYAQSCRDTYKKIRSSL